MSELPAAGDRIRVEGVPAEVLEVHPAGRNLVIDKWSGKQFYEPYPPFVKVRLPDGREVYVRLEQLDAVR